MNYTPKTWAAKLAVAGMAVLALLSGCKQGSPSASASRAENEFRILAGSELKDVAPLLNEFAQKEGVSLVMEYSGSLDAVDRLQQGHNFDAVWLSHGKYPRLVPEVAKQIKTSEKTMYSRVVLGIKNDKLKALGWGVKGGQVAWSQVLGAVQEDKLKLAMTNPAGSNTGFVTLVGLAAELSGKGDALEVEDIPTKKLHALFSAVRLTSGSSGDLAERFKADPAKADLMVNYESTLRSLIEQGMPLTILTPKEGVITADYPLMLLNRSKKQAVYDKLVAFIRQPETQQRIAKTTYRTPLTGASDGVVNELPFPGSLRVVDALLEGYLNTYSRPTTSYFVLDVSGSMRDGRIADLKSAMTSLTSGDGTVSGRFSTFRNRERVSLVPFNHAVLKKVDFELTSNQLKNKALLAEANAFINELRADGGTGIYSALDSVYGQAQAQLKKDEGPVSIVLLTDGKNESGQSFSDFMATVEVRGKPTVPVYAILYGEANSDELTALATFTGGKVFDARKVSLSGVMKSIRNYQ